MVAAFVIGIGIGLALGILLGLVIADMSTSSTLINIPMPSGPIHGNVTGIIDANTLEINGVQVRTTLVDVPEPDEFPNADIMYPINSSCPIGSPAAYDVDDLMPEDGDGVALAAIWCDKMGQGQPAQRPDIRLRIWHSVLWGERVPACAVAGRGLQEARGMIPRGTLQ